MNEIGPNCADFSDQMSGGMPDWVPDGVMRYLAHTEAGVSIRNLARQADVHASTVLRQVRRIETRRDDPLVDAGLSALATSLGFSQKNDVDAGNGKMTQPQSQSQDVPDTATLERESCRILRRLCETGAVLAVADQMEKAVVVRDISPGNGGGTGGGDNSARTAVVDRAIARAMALRDWISCNVAGAPGTPGRVSRYRITSGGRTALGRMLAEAENRARSEKENGFHEAQAGFSPQQEVTTGHRRLRYNAAETPLSALARRKDRDGQPFLSALQVQAGERLREDFELARMGPDMALNWDQFLNGGAGLKGGLGDVDDGCVRARDRMARAFDDLGEGLSDVALRCCCYLEGLEVAEKRMGWSARSGKIVLRIALQRLRLHYQGLSGADRMIG
ncbi:MAG: DUF6456 domain-containing protein [Rhodobacteraceae bacterium]|nr:DUF6456 domain-containing protein [Paracoccaceae bacterium]